MAETSEAAAAETKKIINPRAEIDTSPPFESVKEAVDRFGGSGPWIPHHLLRFAAAHYVNEAFDMEKMEEQAVQLERDVMMKEQQTLNVLKELESAKRFVEGLKSNLIPEMSSLLQTSDHDHGLITLSSPLVSPGLMFTELNQAKLNLSKTSVDLAAIQASVDSLNKKLRHDSVLLERRYCNNINVKEDISITTPDRCYRGDGNGYEDEQFKKMTEASRYEVMKAMAEIEQTKNCIKMAEMRLNAAKKMEEAAKAVEAIAVATRSPSSYKADNMDGITLSFEEYQTLSQKAKQAEELCKTKFVDSGGGGRHDRHHLEAPILEKFEETTTVEHGRVQRSGNTFAKFKFRNSESSERREKPATGGGFRSATTSIGDVLSRKYVVEDDVMVGRHVEEREHVSLSQMLREQSRSILHSSKSSNPAGNHVEKRYIVQRNKFGFIKRKTHPLNPT